MLIDLTVKLTKELIARIPGFTQSALAGHVGTHFDGMGKEFPLAYTRRPAVLFDVTHVRGRDIEAADIDLSRVAAGTFVAFRTGFMDEAGYASKAYYAEHPQLSRALIESLCALGVSIIGVDCAGVRRGREHTPMDQYCADRGVFVVENLCALDAIGADAFTAHTYPLRIEGITGLPCRVVAEV